MEYFNGDPNGFPHHEFPSPLLLRLCEVLGEHWSGAPSRGLVKGNPWQPRHCLCFCFLRQGREKQVRRPWVLPPPAIITFCGVRAASSVSPSLPAGSPNLRAEWAQLALQWAFVCPDSRLAVDSFRLFAILVQNPTPELLRVRAILHSALSLLLSSRSPPLARLSSSSTTHLPTLPPPPPDLRRLITGDGLALAGSVCRPFCKHAKGP